MYNYKAYAVMRRKKKKNVLKLWAAGVSLLETHMYAEYLLFFCSALTLADLVLFKNSLSNCCS